MPTLHRCIYSGSWDYTVRIWGRTTLRTLSVLPCADWVWGVCPRGRHLLVRAFPLELYIA